MNNFRKLMCLILTLAALFALMTGCSKKADEEMDKSGSDPTNAADPTNESDPIGSPDDLTGQYSDQFDENGFFKGVRALDYVDIGSLDYKALKIPNEVHDITEERLQNEINYILAYYAPVLEITDRAVADGDTVNIDFVGSVNGIKFDGGSTNGEGTDVTIGVTDYIDDFLEQLIGHMPGDTFDVNVTFPDEYFEESLQGKAAVFVTTINFIAENDAELNDEFVRDVLSPDYGWESVEEMRTNLRADIKKYNIQQYVREVFANEVAVSAVPDEIIDYQINLMISYYEDYAYYNGTTMDDLLMSEGLYSVEELIENYYEVNVQNATYLLVVLAIAEDSGVVIGEDELMSYFIKYENTDDYSSYVADFGMPYVKHNVLRQLVLDYVIDNAILL